MSVRRFTDWEEPDKYDNLYQIKKTQIFLMYNRGYIIPNEELNLLSTSYEEYEEKKKIFTDNLLTVMETKGVLERAAMMCRYTHKDNSSISTLIQYLDIESRSTTVGIDAIKIAIGEGAKVPIATNLILILPGRLTPPASGTIKVTRNTEIFYDDNMRFSPSQHVFNPIYIPLSREETNEFYRKNNIKMTDLPRMTLSDPNAKYNDWDLGTLVRIIRYEDSLKTIGKVSIYYRVVYGN